MMNPCHADFENPRLWECEVSGLELNDYGLKRIVQQCTTVREMSVPALTTEQRVEIAIRCVLHGCTDDNFSRWAERWLDGTDRSADAALAIVTEAVSKAVSEKTIGGMEAATAHAAAEVAWGAARAAACVGAALEAACVGALGASSKSVWAAASNAVCVVASNAEIDIAAVIEGVVENDRNAQIIEEEKCVTN